MLRGPEVKEAWDEENTPAEEEGGEGGEDGDGWVARRRRTTTTTTTSSLHSGNGITGTVWQDSILRYSTIPSLRNREIEIRWPRFHLVLPIVEIERSPRMAQSSPSAEAGGKGLWRGGGEPAFKGE